MKPNSFDENAQFIKLEDNGGLLIASKDVIVICKKTEVLLKSIIVFDKRVIIVNKKFKIEFVTKAILLDLNYLMTLIFTEMTNPQLTITSFNY